MHRLSHLVRIVLPLLATAAIAGAEVTLDDDALGTSLGGWSKRDKKASEYMFSGSKYCTYKPDVTTTPDGGIFVSLRVDHLRGVFSSDDHAVLELTISSKGTVMSAQSSLALQGLSISSDVIRTGAKVGDAVPVVGGAAKVGGDLMADLSSKLLREKIVEAGRVSYPSVLRHNYNLLCAAIRKDGQPTATAKEIAKEAKAEDKKAEEKKPEEKTAENKKPEEAKPAEGEKKPEAQPKPAETKQAEAKLEEDAKLEIKPFGNNAVSLGPEKK